MQKVMEFNFHASIDSCRDDTEMIVDIQLMDIGHQSDCELADLQVFARRIVFRFAKGNGDGGLFLTSTSKIIGGWIAELERFESFAPFNNRRLHHLFFKVSHESVHSPRQLKQRYLELQRKNRLLIREIEKLDELINKIEEVKESFRIPFDAIKDLMMSFDSNGNILVVNEACVKWFGQSPQTIAKKKCKTLLNQDIVAVIAKICETKQSLTVEEKVNDRILQISYMPMLNRKNGDTEVVMLAQDITKNKLIEEEKMMAGRNEGVSVMGGTVRHILNSSLTAILGFSQLGLSSYQWPKATMVRYLRLIERTALRMKIEISKIAEQKEFVTTKYMDIPGDEECKKIIKIEIDKRRLPD